jgi:N-acetylmuramoyl-L-alanine amidase
MQAANSRAAPVCSHIQIISIAHGCVALTSLGFERAKNIHVRALRSIKKSFWFWSGFLLQVSGFGCRLPAHMLPGPRFLFSLFILLGFCPAGKAGFSTVVIDAGHGGHDRGGIPGQRVCEKDMALDVARRLRTILSDDGLRTVMTRSDDTFIPLPMRSAIANARSNAVFVSIHFNAAPRSGASGFETYYYQGRAAALASRIQGKMAQLGNGENRGVKRRGYYVLRKTSIPAVLCEPGFLTNPGYGGMVQKSAQRQRLAAAIASAIISSSRD